MRPQPHPTLRYEKSRARRPMLDIDLAHGRDESNNFDIVHLLR